MPGAATNTACTVEHGPSLLFNNLTTSSHGLAYVHGNQVNRACDKLQDTMLSFMHSISLLQVSLVKLGSPQDGVLLSPQGSKVSMTPAPLDASMLLPVQLSCAVQAATGLFEHSDKVQQVQICPLADFTCIVIALGTGMQVWHIV